MFAHLLRQRPSEVHDLAVYNGTVCFAVSTRRIVHCGFSGSEERHYGGDCEVLYFKMSQRGRTVIADASRLQSSNLANSDA